MKHSKWFRFYIVQWSWKRHVALWSIRAPDFISIDLWHNAHVLLGQSGFGQSKANHGNGCIPGVPDGPIITLAWECLFSQGWHLICDCFFHLDLFWSLEVHPHCSAAAAVLTEVELCFFCAWALTGWSLSLALESNELLVSYFWKLYSMCEK